MIDTTSDRISQGAEAQATLNRLKPYLAERREAVIRTLLAHHHDDSLTEGNMRSLIAALAELYKLEDDLSHKVRLGRKDLEAMR